MVTLRQLPVVKTDKNNKQKKLQYDESVFKINMVCAIYLLGMPSFNDLPTCSFCVEHSNDHSAKKHQGVFFSCTVMKGVNKPLQVDNMVLLLDASETNVQANLKQRYDKNLIYV